MIKIYFPVEDIRGSLEADLTGLDMPSWRDKEYLDFFEGSLQETHKETTATVSVRGVEYKNCNLFVPKIDGDDKPYIAVDENYAPFSHFSRFESRDLVFPHRDWSTKWLLRCRDSEKYYQDHVLDLSSKYVAPNIIWDDEEESVLNHPDSITKSSRVLLVGQPGAGKTSFVRYLTQYHMRCQLDERKKDKARAVFYFQLREFAHRPNELQSWLLSEESESGLSNDVANNVNQKFLFVFDGLDELNENDRNDFVVWLTSFLESKPALSTIVTSRDLSSLKSGIWDTFRKAHIQPFNHSQMSEYCRLIVGDNLKVNKFVEVVDANPDLSLFFRNPFSLSLALGMYMVRGILPLNLGVLCKEVVAQLIERWDNKRGISRISLMSVESMNSTLGRLAYRLQRKSMFQFAPDFLDDLLPVEMESIGSLGVLQDLSERTGLVTQNSGLTWSFSHRYFQDFFCANYLVEKVGGLSSEFNQHGGDENWIDVWRQVGQLCQDPEFFALAINREDSDTIKSIDRMISSLLSHDGISKYELNAIVAGLIDELNKVSSIIPPVKITQFGAEIDCRKLSDASIQVLAKTISDLNYLKHSHAGYVLLSEMNASENNDFADFIRRLLLQDEKSVPKVGSSVLELYFSKTQRLQ